MTAKHKKRIHALKITVTFDKPCSVTHAAKEVADCIHGDFYPTQYDDRDDPGLFKVVKIVRLNRRCSS